MANLLCTVVCIVSLHSNYPWTFYLLHYLILLHFWYANSHSQPHTMSPKPCHNHYYSIWSQPCSQVSTHPSVSTASDGKLHKEGLEMRLCSTVYALPSLHQQTNYTNGDEITNRLGEASFPSLSRGGVLGNGFCWRPSKNLKCSCRCDFTSQIASQINPQHLKPKFLLRRMPPEPLDNASNSFPSKLKILDSSVKNEGTAHNRPSSGNLLGEKEAFYIRRQASWVYYHLFTWWNYCVSLYLWTLSVEKSCGSDCIIKSLAELFIESCIFV